MPVPTSAAPPPEGRVGATTAHRLEPGPWPCDAERDGTVVAVTDGLIMRTVTVGDTVSAQLYGPGEMTTCRDAGDALLTPAATWTALSRATVTTVDVATAAAGPKWPQMAQMLVEGLEDQARRSRELIMIAHLPRSSDRVHALLLHLAERYGRVVPGRLLIPIELTHSTIGALIGARRPTVSLALRQLDSQGLVQRRHDGYWLVDADHGGFGGQASLAAVA